MNILYDMINEKAKTRWGKAAIDLDNFPIWSECWFNTALELKEDFKKEGLVDTAQAISNIVVTQRRFFPKKKEPDPIEDNKPDIASRRRAFLEGN